jgi:hypothetical protein
MAFFMRSLKHHTLPVGASLLAIAACQSTEMLIFLASSRAGSLPHLDNARLQPFSAFQILLTTITPANTTAPATIPATAFNNVGTINPAPPAPALTLSIQ